MTTTTSDASSLAVLGRAEAQAESMKTLRAELRRQSQPGDPEREARIQDALLGQLLVMSEVRGVLSKLIWGTAKLTDSDDARLRAASNALAAERRQLKKMLR